jgi:hypothetical protein
VRGHVLPVDAELVVVRVDRRDDDGLVEGDVGVQHVFAVDGQTAHDTRDALAAEVLVPNALANAQRDFETGLRRVLCRAHESAPM